MTAEVADPTTTPVDTSPGVPTRSPFSTTSPEPPIDLSEFTETLQESREVEQSNDLYSGYSAPTGGVDVPGLSAIQPFLLSSVFTSFFRMQARMRYAHPDEQGRVQQLAEDRPRMYKWCSRSDFAVRMTAVLMIYGTIGATVVGVLRKTFFS